MMEEPMKIAMDYAQLSETLKTSLKLKGSPVAIAFANTADEIPPGMVEIDKVIKHCMMVSLARTKEKYSTLLQTSTNAMAGAGPWDSKN
jgi:uncharacterized protein (DUF169 family)